MKKVYYIILLMSIILLTACGETKVAITADKATDNEIIVASKGKMQTSIKESFDKSYYNKDNLEQFIKDDISNFNSQNGTKVGFNSMKVKKDNVYVVIDYPTINDYNAYDDYQVTSLSSNEAKGNSLVPSKLKVYGKTKSISKENALKNGKFSAIVLSAKEGSTDENKINTKLTVAGKIKYVSNVKKVDSNTVKVTSLKEPAVVIYK